MQEATIPCLHSDQKNLDAGFLDELGWRRCEMLVRSFCLTVYDGCHGEGCGDDRELSLRNQQRQMLWDRAI